MMRLCELKLLVYHYRNICQPGLGLARFVWQVIPSVSKFGNLKATIGLLGGHLTHGENKFFAFYGFKL